MAQHRPKSLYKCIAQSVAWLTALAVALSCGIGYWLMAKTLLTERRSYLTAEIGRQAAHMQDGFAQQMAWLTMTARELSLADAEQVPQLLSERERTNGNLHNMRACVSGTLYENGEVLQDETRLQEDWIVAGYRMDTYLPVVETDLGPRMTLVVPIRCAQGQSGVLAADYLLGDFLGNVSRINLIEGGYALLLDSSGETLVHPAQGEANPFFLGAVGYVGAAKSHTMMKDYDGAKRYFVSAKLEALGWTLLYGIDLYSLLRPTLPLLWILGALVFFSWGIAVLLTFWRLEALETPLREMSQVAQEMKRGRYHGKIQYANADEFGEVCRTLEEGLTRTAEHVDEVAHTLGRMAQGDFSAPTGEQGIGEFVPIWDAISKISAAMHGVFKQVNLTAKWALGGSHQVSGVLGRFSVGIESQTNSVEELNKSAMLLRHESNQNALNASRAQESALLVGSDLRSSDRFTAELQGALREVDDAMRAVLPLFEVIRKSVTNGRMLSMSASAEAERIGEQAHAFVLTVDELRSMFVYAMKSTEEIGEKISAAQNAVSRAKDCVGVTSDSLKRIMSKNTQTAELVGRIASASQLQAQAAAKMSKEVSVISVVIQSNLQLAEQFDLSCGSLSDQAKVLSEMSCVFHTKGAASEDEKSAPIILDEDSGSFSVTEGK